MIAASTDANGTTRARSVLALRHVHFEDLGVLAPVLVARGYRIRYLDVGIDELDAAEVVAADLLVVLGGPIGVYEDHAYPFLATEIDVIRARIAQRRPTLGICLGAQLIAEAMGARVRPTGAVEIGFGKLRLTREGHRSVLGGLDGVAVLHWHGDEFDIPAGARLLAGTDGFPHQAFILDRVLGLQFHLETDHRRIESWLIGHAHELRHHGIDPAVIREQMRILGPVVARAAEAVIGAWLDEGEDSASG